jgi:hypothetical protein
MTSEKTPSRFELAYEELRALGIVLARLPGEYRVNVRNGSEKTARFADDLDEAVELGRAMAAEAVAASKPLRRKKRRRKIGTVKRAFARGGARRRRGPRRRREG